MRRGFGAKPFLYPRPVLMIATCGEDSTPDIMNAAQGGIADMKQMAMYLSVSRKTMKNVLARRASTVSMADADHVTECDYLGIILANQMPDKVARTGFHVTKSTHVDAPLVDELPLTLECRFVSFDEKSELLVSEIVNISVDECILNADGTTDPARLRPITFDMADSAYLVPGEKVGNAFQDGKKLKWGDAVVRRDSPGHRFSS